MLLEGRVFWGLALVWMKVRCRESNLRGVVEILHHSSTCYSIVKQREMLVRLRRLKEVEREKVSTIYIPPSTPLA